MTKTPWQRIVSDLLVVQITAETTFQADITGNAGNGIDVTGNGGDAFYANADDFKSRTTSFPNVNSPTFVTASVALPSNPSSTAINPITINFTEYVLDSTVDISDFRLLRRRTAISGASNTAPIVITSLAHGLLGGEQVYIRGVKGNTNANGVFEVRNVTANTFELFTPDGLCAPVSGNAGYTSGGRWVRNVNLAGIPVTQETEIRYVFDLTGLTGTSGAYRFSMLANSGLTEIAGNALASAAGQFNIAAQDNWTFGPDVSPTGTITDLTGNPLANDTDPGTPAGVASQVSWVKNASGPQVSDSNTTTAAAHSNGDTVTLRDRSANDLQRIGLLRKAHSSSGPFTRPGSELW